MPGSKAAKTIFGELFDATQGPSTKTTPLDREMAAPYRVTASFGDSSQTRPGLMPCEANGAGGAGAAWRTLGQLHFSRFPQHRFLTLRTSDRNIPVSNVACQVPELVAKFNMKTSRSPLVSRGRGEETSAACAETLEALAERLLSALVTPVHECTGKSRPGAKGIGSATLPDDGPKITLRNCPEISVVHPRLNFLKSNQAQVCLGVSCRRTGFVRPELGSLSSISREEEDAQEASLIGAAILVVVGLVNLEETADNAALAKEFELPFSDLTPKERELLLWTRNSGWAPYEGAPDLAPKPPTPRSPERLSARLGDAALTQSARLSF
ncbi:hypothetical protein HPB47_001857 [Ixodes persulcatus]|uniref:Uncharacterized protein n=1 Tax=Ixodes persulcatus TaxID=34615 RepID=A0AC60PMU9_IXOPE|nr:hypothetical protein HPB47_001857 [Ixodes persulcatus]